MKNIKNIALAIFYWTLAIGGIITAICFISWMISKTIFTH
jgi:hypothetical protein